MSKKWEAARKGRQQSKKRRKQSKDISYIHKVARSRVEDKLEESYDEKAERAAWVKKEYGEKGMRMCGSKRKYATQFEAQRSIDRRQADYPMRTYKCKICDGWHITHAPKQEKPADDRADGNGKDSAKAYADGKRKEN